MTPVLATLVLMAITVVGAVLVYQILFRNAAVQSSNGQVSVQSATLLMVASSGSGTGVFSITVENTGNKLVTNVTLAVNNVTQNPASCPPPPPPALPQRPTFCVGAAKISTANPLTLNGVATATGTPSTTASGTLPMSFTFGSSYTYRVLVTFSEGSTSVAAGTVVASNS